MCSPGDYANSESEATGCEILGKCEFMYPGASAKDRAAKYMILGAEARGDIEPGALVVEGTAGNTDIGQRYQSKVFNPEFLRSKELPVPDGWREPGAPSWRPSVRAD